MDRNELDAAGMFLVSVGLNVLAAPLFFLDRIVLTDDDEHPAIRDSQRSLRWMDRGVVSFWTATICFVLFIAATGRSPVGFTDAQVQMLWQAATSSMYVGPGVVLGLAVFGNTAYWLKRRQPQLFAWSESFAAMLVTFSLLREHMFGLAAAVKAISALYLLAKAFEDHAAEPRFTSFLPWRRGNDHARVPDTDWPPIRVHYWLLVFPFAATIVGYAWAPVLSVPLVTKDRYYSIVVLLLMGSQLLLVMSWGLRGSAYKQWYARKRQLARHVAGQVSAAEPKV